MKWPWGIAVFADRKAQVPSQREIAAQALRQAVAMAKAKECGVYHVGFAAWDNWIEKLVAIDTADEKEVIPKYATLMN